MSRNIEPLRAEQTSPYLTAHILVNNMLMTGRANGFKEPGVNPNTLLNKALVMYVRHNDEYATIIFIPYLGIILASPIIKARRPNEALDQLSDIARTMINDLITTFGSYKPFQDFLYTLSYNEVTTNNIFMNLENIDDLDAWLRHASLCELSGLVANIIDTQSTLLPFNIKRGD